MYICVLAEKAAVLYTPADVSLAWHKRLTRLCPKVTKRLQEVAKSRPFLHVSFRTDYTNKI